MKVDEMQVDGSAVKKERGVVLGQADAVLFRILYATKYCTFWQAHSTAYFDLTERSFRNRLRFLNGAGFVNFIRKDLPPGAHTEFDPISVPLVGGAHGGRVALPAKNVGQVRDRYTLILFLGPKGEEWLRHELAGAYRRAGPVRPNPMENWSHELSITRILCDQLFGPLPDRLTQLSEWNWLTGYRGFTNSGKALSGLSGNLTDIRTLTPDSVITHPDRPERLFLEYDRGTKPLGRPKNNPKYRDTITATLEAYYRLFKYSYKIHFPDEGKPTKPPLLVYAVPDRERREAILEIAGKHYPELPLRVRTADTIRAWFNDWLSGSDRPAKPTVVKENPDEEVRTYVVRLEKTVSVQKKLIDQALEVFIGLRRLGAPVALPPDWERRLKEEEEMRRDA